MSATIFKLRDYQKKGIDLTRQAYSDGYRKILFFLATGGGKSVIFLEFIHNLLHKKGKVVLVMKRKQLVHQAYRKFVSSGIKCSMVMGNCKEFDPTLDLQICSIDTINRRDLAFLAGFKTVVIDEAHDTTSDQYKNFFSKINAELYIGLTATPFKVGKKCQSFWECCVKPIEAHELRDLGFLTDCSIKVPDELDLEGISISRTTSDYDSEELAKKMSELVIVGDIINSYKEFGNNQAAILFAVNKAHSIMLAHEFNQNGIPAIHCDESTSQERRDAAIQMLRDGKIKVLCNVNIFSTGVDIPEAIVGIMARPTMSEILYIQQIGRLLRPYRKCGKCQSQYDNSANCPVCGYDKPSFIKQFAIIIDNANNIFRHGSPWKIRKAILSEKDQKEKESEELMEFKVKRCKKCKDVYESHLKSCPNCQFENEKVEKTIKTSEGKMVPYDEYSFMERRLKHYQRIQLERGLKANYPYFKLYEEYGDDVYKYRELDVPRFVKSIVEKNKKEDKRNYS